MNELNFFKIGSTVQNKEGQQQKERKKKKKKRDIKEDKNVEGRYDDWLS